MEIKAEFKAHPEPLACGGPEPEPFPQLAQVQGYKRGGAELRASESLLRQSQLFPRDRMVPTLVPTFPENHQLSSVAPWVFSTQPKRGCIHGALSTLPACYSPSTASHCLAPLKLIFRSSPFHPPTPSVLHAVCWAVGAMHPPLLLLCKGVLPHGAGGGPQCSSP